MKKVFHWFSQVIFSALIIGALFFIIINFYIFSSSLSFGSFFYLFLLISGITDGFLILIHFPRRPQRHSELKFDESKLTILIACFNGEKIISETINQASKHVPLDQIFVISDASTDKTAEVANNMGVRVIENKKNINKAFSISKAAQYVKTDYVLILDDDTLIGDTFIPTSLLDDGYSAVAFNVMPMYENTLINKLQQFEYRKSMQIGKNLRANVGAIGNVSGAIGLFRTKDIKKQIRIHSGQFGGEDEQRTALIHLLSSEYGVTYTDATVTTKAPDTWTMLMRQRSFKWNLSLPELFFLYWRILLNPKHHYLLKTEKAYQIYIYLTDPLRILFFWTLFVHPAHIFTAYFFYLGLTLLVWFRTKCKDPLSIILIFPFYTLFVSVCRFIAHFYWFKIKAQYVFKKRYHKVVTGRKLVAEYSFIMIVISVIWVSAILIITREMSLLNKVRTNILNDTSSGQFRYENQTSQESEIQNESLQRGN